MDPQFQDLFAWWAQGPGTFGPSLFLLEVEDEDLTPVLSLSASLDPGLGSAAPAPSAGSGSDGSTPGFRHRGAAVPASSAADGLRGSVVQIR